MKEYSTIHYAEFLEQRFSSGMLTELQPYPHFVTWCKTEQGKKLPINPTTGKAASTIHPETWGTLDQALSALRKGHGQGIGFVFSADDPFTGIDIDSCIVDKTLTPAAKEQATVFSSYTEVSPSKTGLHILVRGSVPEGRRKNGIEIYSTGRYFTLTTNHLKGTPDTIEERQSQLSALYASLTQNEDHRELFKPQEHQVFISDEKVLEKAQNASNGERFTALYNGNIGGHTSKSEADFELVLRLLYWTNDDEEQVQRLFRQSGLYDEKTDRQTNGITYLEVTIANALKKRQKK